MRTLILCVDRDDDLGEKAKVPSPVVGRKNNLKAVIALGLEDPEDSDANVMLMGLKLYKRYKDMGREVEIATICGDKMVGMKSDENLLRQFFSVLEQFKPDSVVLVSDGAEDEVILPLISQRVQIEHISRVVVKQQQNLESLYYIIMSAFKNPKIGKKVIVPIALMIMVWGILMIWGLVSIAVGLMLTLFALFLMVKALNIEDQFTRVLDDLRDVMRTGRYLLFLGVAVSLVIVMGGLIWSFLQARPKEDLGGFLFTFLKSVWIFFIGGAFVYTLGNSLDGYFRTGKFVRSTGLILMALMAVGFLTYTAVNVVGYALKIDEIDLQTNAVTLGIGMVVLALSGLVYLHGRSRDRGSKRRMGWLR